MQLFKIFYDKHSLQQIEAPFRPLDNREGPSGWFELFPILNYLETVPLEENVWYGFFSPKFPEKANVTVDDIRVLITTASDCDVALFSSNWTYLALYQNVWTQAEASHPGTIKSFQSFLKSQGIESDLSSSISTFENSVFSNYLIAKPRFWLEWAKLARSYFDYVESIGTTGLDNQRSNHIGPSRYMLKTFVQERLACWMLENGSYSVVHTEYGNHPIPYVTHPLPATITKIAALTADKLKRLGHVDKWRSQRRMDAMSMKPRKLSAVLS